MQVLNMKAAQVMLHASMYVTFGKIIIFPARECWHCSDDCIVWPESGCDGHQCRKLAMSI